METISIGYQSGKTDVREVIENVFGQLVKLAQPVITDYRSDLYWDAVWLQENMTGSEFTFFWGVRKYGTHIGQDSALIGRYADNLYSITVTCDEGRFTMTVTPDKEN